MAKVDKAQITYVQGEAGSEVETTLRFHSVISEEHEVSSTVTEYPSQEGFDVSSHAIRKSRRVTIEGVVTNHLIVGSEEFHEYGGNNSRIMFSTLKGLVQASVPCEVVTNYDSYSPVIFDRLRTKLQAGMTDIMKFTLSGLETQVSPSQNASTPTLITFTPLTEDERVDRVTELLAAGLEVPDDAVLSQATVDLNTSFQMQTNTVVGDQITMTYNRKDYDPVKQEYTFEVSTSDTNLEVGTASTSFNWYSLLNEQSTGLTAGAITAGACVSDGLVNLGTTIAEDVISTSLGDLRKTAYGAAYETFGVSGNRSLGQQLLALGTDCFVAGIVGTVDPDLDQYDFQSNKVPTVAELLLGAKRVGNVAVSSTVGVAAPTTITKITAAGESLPAFGL